MLPISATMLPLSATMLPVLATVSNEISSFRQSRNKLNMFNLFRFCQKDETSFHIVAKIVAETGKMATMSKQHLTLWKERYFTINLFEIVVVFGRPRRQTEIVNGARIASTRAMSEHRCFPKKRLSTHIMHFRRVTGRIRVSVTRPSPWNTGLPFGFFLDFLIPKMAKIPKFLSGNPDGTQSVQLFLPGP